MKYPYIVNKNGVWYPSGADVPEGNNLRESIVSTPEKKKESKYTKTEIIRMSTDDLRKLALDSGMENGETMTGTDLKKHFISWFGL